MGAGPGQRPRRSVADRGVCADALRQERGGHVEPRKATAAEQWGRREQVARPGKPRAHSWRAGRGAPPEVGGH